MTLETVSLWCMILLNILLVLYILITNGAVIWLAWKQWIRGGKQQQQQQQPDSSAAMEPCQQVILVNLVNFAAADLVHGVFWPTLMAVQFINPTEDVVAPLGTFPCKWIGSLQEVVPEIPGFLMIGSFIVSMLVSRRQSSHRTPRAALIIHGIGWILPMLLLGPVALVIYGIETPTNFVDETPVCYWLDSYGIRDHVKKFWNLIVVLMVLALNVITVSVRYRCCLPIERRHSYEGYRFAYGLIFLVCIVYERFMVTPLDLDYASFVSDRPSLSATHYIPFTILMFALQNLRLVLNPIVPFVYFIRNPQAVAAAGGISSLQL